MIRLTPLEPVVVPFVGECGRRGPLTFGQINILDWLETWADPSLGWMRWVLDLPETATLEDVIATFSTLLARHEALRTTYHLEPLPEQHVAATGQLVLRIFTTSADTTTDAVDQDALVEALGRELDGEMSPDPLTHPLRVALCVRSGAVLAGVAEYSHMAGDYLALGVLTREFHEMIRNPRSRVVGGKRHQPLDQALAEAGPQLEPRITAALDRWENWLQHAPPHHCVAEHGHGLSGSASAELRSKAAAAALRRVSTRTGVSAASVVLAAVCAVLARRSGYSACSFTALANNRYNPQLADYVGTIVQSVPMTVETGDASFDELAQRCWAAVVQAGRFGLYGIRERTEIAERIQRKRGILFYFEPTFNNYAVESPSSQPPVTEYDTKELEALAVQSELHWTEKVPTKKPLRFDLHQTSDTLVLSLWTGYLERVPKREIETLLYAVERLLLAAASGDLSHDMMCAAMGVSPITRGPDWILIDSCWVEVSETQRLVDDALAPTPAKVFAQVDDRFLVAYLAADPLLQSPSEAHTRCMAALPGRLTAMAPRYYVLTDRAPLDMDDLDDWRRQPVLAEGSGR